MNPSLDSAGAVWLLPALVLTPLVGALVLLVAPRLGDRVSAIVGTVTAAVTAVWAVALAVVRPDALNVPWIPALGVRLHLTVDPISVPLVLLTAGLGVLTTLYLVHLHADRVDEASRGRVRGLVICVLVVLTGALLTFTAADAVLFYLAFEVVLIPMWVMIAFWGDPSDEAARRDAANRFILFTAVGSAIMLLGVILVGVTAGTFDLVELAHRHGAGIGPTIQLTAAGLMVLGLAVKTPAFPLHTWLPAAHTKAPTVGSVLLAGVLLKMGTYGMIRLVVPVVPDGLHQVAPVLAAFAVAGVLWGSLACLAETDLKRLVAFSSVAHMGFVLLGIASGTAIGLQGALYGNLAHGVISALLFVVAGGIKDRHHSANLAVIGEGLRARAPHLGWLLAFGAVAGLGLPGLAGFWGELMAVAGAWQGTAVLGPIGRPLAVIAGIGTALASAYLLRVLRQVWQGRADASPPVPDASVRERAVAWPLVAAIVVLGLVPWPVLDLTAATVRTLVGVSAR